MPNIITVSCNELLQKHADKVNGEFIWSFCSNFMLSSSLTPFSFWSLFFCVFFFLVFLCKANGWIIKDIVWIGMSFICFTETLFLSIVDVISVDVCRWKNGSELKNNIYFNEKVNISTLVAIDFCFCSSYVFSYLTIGSYSFYWRQWMLQISYKGWQQNFYMKEFPSTFLSSKINCFGAKGHNEQKWKENVAKNWLSHSKELVWRTNLEWVTAAANATKSLIFFTIIM